MRLSTRLHAVVNGLRDVLADPASATTRLRLLANEVEAVADDLVRVEALEAVVADAANIFDADRPAGGTQ
ncbi:MAG: hypothetical protein AB7E47_12975 [Desulfovibrionaceae bacterium]